VLAVPAATTTPTTTAKKYDRYNAIRENSRLRKLKLAALAQPRSTPMITDFRRRRKATRRRLTEPARGLRLLEIEELCRRGERPAIRRKLHHTWPQQSSVEEGHVFCSSFQEFKQKHDFGPEKVREELGNQLDLELISWFDDQEFF